MRIVSAVSKLSTAVQPSTTCPNCGFAAWSEPAHLTWDELQQIDEQVVHFRRIRRREYVHRAGAPLRSLSIIHSGFLKTSITNCRGNVQVTEFSMRGDLVGMDAISTGVHQCDAIALEDTYVMRNCL
jgi:CRP/FNR family transcriptional regulator